MEETQLRNGLENLQIPKKEEEFEYEREDDGNSHRLQASGSLRTRSQVAPDWTVQESIILVNEISAVEGDCLNTLSSFQKWKIIVENCNALEVNRSLNQCRRKWDSLLADYKMIKQWESEARGRSYWSLDGGRRREFGIPENLHIELFKAIDDHEKARGGRSDTDPDSDPEAKADVLKFFMESGPRKRRRSRVMPQKHTIEGRIKSQKWSIGKKIKHEPCSLDESVQPLKHSMDEKLMLERSNEEQMMAAKLQENAELISAILQGNLNESKDYRLADLKNIEAFRTDVTRRQGDQLITCLGYVAETLDQLCCRLQEYG